MKHQVRKHGHKFVATLMAFGKRKTVLCGTEAEAQRLMKKWSETKARIWDKSATEWMKSDA